MKKLLFITALLFLFILPAQAQDDIIFEYDNDYVASESDLAEELQYVYNWYINGFDAQYIINKDASIDVNEKIRAYFNIEKHGIYRYIPTKYQDDKGFNYNLRLTLDSVVDENGRDYNIADLKRSNPFYLKIGDPDFTFYGPAEYNINYQVERGIRFFDTHDEFYWNVTGYDWDTDILKASAKVLLPLEVNMDEVDVYCYAGQISTQEQYCNYLKEDNGVYFYTTDILGDDNYEDFTIVVTIPKGVLTEPTQKEYIIMWLKDNWFLGMPILSFLIMFLVWYKFGKDKKHKSIVAQYEERSDLSPFTVDLLMKDRTTVNSKALSAEIINLAVKGYLKIDEIVSDSKAKKIKVEDYKLTRLKDSDDQLFKYQKIVLNGLFEKGSEVKLKDLKDNFYKNLSDIRGRLQDYSYKWYSSKPFMKWAFWGLAIFVAIISIGLGNFFSRQDFIIGGIMSAIIIAIFAFFMPQKNSEGMEAHWYVLGLREYINVAERYRAKFYEDKNIFEKVLPYAMVFGLVNKWADAFKGIYTEKPQWYGGYRPFNIIIFADTLSKFTTSTSKNVVATSNSSGAGGGFSGGGFGGGGGGSW